MLFEFISILARGLSRVGIRVAFLPFLAFLLTGFVARDFNAVHRYTQQSPNLIRNGSFESNRSVVEWDGWWEGLSTTTPLAAFKVIEADSNIPAYEGNRLLAATYSRQSLVDDVALKFMSDFFPIEPNKEYTLTFRYQARRVANGIVKPLIQQWSARGQVYNVDSARFDSLTDGAGAGYSRKQDTAAPPYQNVNQWTLYTYRFKTGADARFGRLYLLYGKTLGAGGTFYFDDVRLTEGGLNASPPTAITRKYLDGNNHPLQTVTQNDTTGIIAATFYDNMGRISKSTLPVGQAFRRDTVPRYFPDFTGLFAGSDSLSRYYSPSANPGKKLTSGKVGPALTYPDAGGAPFSETRYESSPLGRVVEEAGPGASLKMGAGHTTRMKYVSVPSLQDYSTLPSIAGDTGDFFVKEVVDPDSQVTREFTDRMGRIVRKSSRLSGSWVNTDYSYDVAGNLVKIEAPTVSGERLTTEMAYNTLKELVSETTPSTGTTRFVYDVLGRARFSQTAKQEALGRFSYAKYDDFGRVVETGELLDDSLFSVGSFADTLRFPCLDCGAATVDEADLRIRTLNHYDDTSYSEMSCGASGVTFSDSAQGQIAYLVRGPDSSVAAAGYDLWNTYSRARSHLLSENDTGDAEILVIHDSLAGNVTPMRNGKSLDLLVDSALRFTMRPVARGTDAGDLAQLAFDAEENKEYVVVLDPPEFLLGKLTKAMSCNYELVDSLAEETKEVSKTFRYDRYGNVTQIVEINGYVEDPDRQVQMSRNSYDLQNRITRKVLCGDLACVESNSHVENYLYDAMGRVSAVTDKNGKPFVSNSYNAIGQLSLQYLDAKTNDTTFTLARLYTYRAQGWPDSIKTVVGSINSPVFKEKLYYENGSPARYGGDISRADVALDGSALSPSLSYVYTYDKLNRLVSAAPTPTNISANESYAYSNDGRISKMVRGADTGSYAYDTNGRLVEVEGDLVSGRDMEGTPFLYDVNGNLVVDSSKAEGGVPLQIFYRADNLPYLFRFKNGDGEIVRIFMIYDEAGNRVSKITYKDGDWVSNKNYFSSGKEVREQLETTSLEFYGMAGVGRISYSASKPLGHREYYLVDHLGSTREVYDVDSAKVTYSTHSYPYGKALLESRTASEDVTQKFTTKELDDGIELTYFGARYYDQDLGVWTSPDMERQYHDLYSYTGGNPINNVDPDGNADYGSADALNDQGEATTTNPNFQATGSRTFCNYATQEIVNSPNAESPVATPITGTANQMYEKLDDPNVASSVSPERATELAKNGITVIVAWRNGSGSGHVAVVAPTVDAQGRPNVFNVGPKQYTGVVSVAKAFGQTKREDAKNFGYFVLKQDMKSFQSRGGK